MLEWILSLGSACFLHVIFTPSSTLSAVRDGCRQHWLSPAVWVPGKARLWETFPIVYHRPHWYQENTLASLKSQWLVCLLRGKNSIWMSFSACIYESVMGRTECFKSWYNKTAAKSLKKKPTEKQRDENRLDMWYSGQGWESKPRLLSHRQHQSATRSSWFLTYPWERN